MRFVRVVQCKRFWRELSLAAMLCLAHVAIGHDFWIEPSTFRPVPGAQTSLALHVGSDFKGESAIFNPQYFNRYIVAGPDGERKTGIYAAIYDSKKFDVSFDDFNKFQDYLKEEGLERQLAFARARGAAKITEMYSRCAKTLIVAGLAAGPTGVPTGSKAGPTGPTATGFDHYFKCALELVAENNPYAMKPNGELRLKLMFREKPIEGVLVAAFNKADPTNKMKARTDRDGRVTFMLPRNGVWLLKAVHMIVPPRLIFADWESFWASLTFEMP
jgi:hypothetical protein